MLQPQQISRKILAPHFRPLTGNWFRGIDLQFITTPLQYSHTVKRASRFSYSDQRQLAFPLIYLAENHDTALKEVRAFFNPPGSQLVIPNPLITWVILNVVVSLNAVLDLTDENVQGLLHTNLQELTGDWVGYFLRTQPGSSVRGKVQPAPTQILGAALYRIPNLSGFITVSSQDPIRKNLIIFPDKIKTPADGKIEFTDPSSSIVHQIP